MPTRLNPYLNFRNNAQEAMEFYQSVFGGELSVSTFGDFGVSDDADEKDKVMHSQLESPNGLVLMAADVPNSMDHTVGNNVSVSLSGEDEATLTEYWNGISAGATINEQLTKAPWGDTFGMCTDKFGVHWLVNITGAGPEEPGANPE